MKNVQRLAFFMVWGLMGVACSHTGPYSEPVRGQKPKARDLADKVKESENLKPYSRFKKGLYLFQKGDLKQARLAFESIYLNDPPFVPALLELAKINYKEGRWDHFFGLTSYYRRILLADTVKANKNFKQEFLALEILALIRHCRFKESEKVRLFGLQMARDLKKDSSKIQKTAYFFNLKNWVGDQKLSTTSWKKQINLWPLKGPELKWLDNPKNVRVRVNSHC